MKVAPVPSGTSRGDGAAMELRQALHDGESETEPSVRPKLAPRGLPEALEHVGKQLGRNAEAGIGYANLDACRLARRHPP
jgi:hypothetical protein